MPAAIAREARSVKRGRFPGRGGRRHPRQRPGSTAAASAAGLSLEIKFLPWVRGESDVKGGAAFATFPYAKTDERLKIYDFSDPIFVAHSALFFHEGSGTPIDWTTVKDLQKYKIGGVRGFWYVDALIANGIKPELTDNTESAVKMLKEGRFTYLLENEQVGLVTIKKVFPEDAANFKLVAKRFDEKSFHLMVSRTYPGATDILKKFNAGLATIRKNGTYAAIMAKNGMSEK